MTEASARATGVGARPALFADAGWPLVVFIWAVYAAATAFSAFPTVVEQLSTDDAMRLVEVRDLLAGQGWLDLVQHRLNPPDGVTMHWSRVIDLPIAALLAGLRLVVSEDLATRLTITIWPLILFLPALLAAASACRTLAGPAAGAIGAFMMVMSPGVASRFQPASIDHHGAQIALALLLLACAMRLDRSVRAGVAGGLAAALMMAIGMETAPHVAAAAALVALRWAASDDADERAGRGVAAFGLSFAAGTFGVAVLTLSPESWLAPVCDALGVGHIAVATLGGLGLAAAVRYAGPGRIARFAALGQVGVAVAVGLLIASPNCLNSPYGALPEQLKTGWLDKVQEAQNIAASSIAEPTATLAIGLPLFALVAVAIWAVIAAPRENRWPVAIAAAMCAASVAVTCWQIRGASLAFALGGVLLPLAVLAIGRTGGRLRTVLALVAFSPATLALAGLGVADIAGLPAIRDGGAMGGMCRSADYRALAAKAPQGLALNTIDVGPALLAHTGLSVVGAPYHRNVDGLTAALDAFGGSEETARSVALSRGAAFVVVCATDGGVTPYAEENPGGFSAKLLSGPAPAWLEPIDLGPDAKLKAWRVLRGR
ncbi:hypothetical protein ACFOWB_03180 [Chenggangzhangella methanolivorans]